MTLDEPYGAPGPSVLVLNDSATQLVRQRIDLNGPALVVIVSAPFCHFCDDALRDIERDVPIRQALDKTAMWLVVPDGNLRFEDVADWNRRHPSERMSLAYTVQEWPMIDDWDLPTFYFFRNGKLVTEFSGWPPESNIPLLRQGLQHIGALAQGSVP